MEKEAMPPDTRPQCRRRRFNAKMQKRQCTNKGVYVTVKREGEGHTDVMCNRCIDETRAEGWTVRYALEGNKAAPAEPEVKL